MATGRIREIDRIVTVKDNDGNEHETTKGDLFIQNLARGMSQKTAAHLAGIAEATVVENVARGENRDPERPGDERLAAFAVRVREAKSQGQGIHERSITIAAVPRQVTTTSHKTGFRETILDGQVIRLVFDETVVSTREEFDWRAAAWALLHQYGVNPPPQEVELTIPADRAAQAHQLTESFRAYLAGRDDQRAEDDEQVSRSGP